MWISLLCCHPEAFRSLRPILLNTFAGLQVKSVVVQRNRVSLLRCKFVSGSRSKHIPICSSLVLQAEAAAILGSRVALSVIDLKDLRRDTVPCRNMLRSYGSERNHDHCGKKRTLIDEANT
jgi:hypothetical protein